MMSIWQTEGFSLHGGWWLGSRDNINDDHHTHASLTAMMDGWCSWFLMIETSCTCVALGLSMLETSCTCVALGLSMLEVSYPDYTCVVLGRVCWVDLDLSIDLEKFAARTQLI